MINDHYLILPRVSHEGNENLTIVDLSEPRYLLRAKPRRDVGASVEDIEQRLVRKIPTAALALHDPEPFEGFDCLLTVGALSA